MSYINPLPPELRGDDLIYPVQAGGKPNPGTKPDKRLKENKPMTTKRATPKKGK